MMIQKVGKIFRKTRLKDLENHENTKKNKKCQKDLGNQVVDKFSWR